MAAYTASEAEPIDLTVLGYPAGAASIGADGTPPPVAGESTPEPPKTTGVLWPPR